LESLLEITARTAPQKLPGFIVTSSGNISANAVLSAINAILTDDSGLAMLEAFDYAISETSTANVANEKTADETDRNLAIQKEAAELTQFRA
jgi:hypothetical protein